MSVGCSSTSSYTEESPPCSASTADQSCDKYLLSLSFFLLPKDSKNIFTSQIKTINKKKVTLHMDKATYTSHFFLS